MKKRNYFLLFCLLLSSCEYGSILESSSDGHTTTESGSNSSEMKDPNQKDKNITWFLGSDQDIHRINIHTENQTIPQDKENYISGVLDISEQDTTKCILSANPIGIRLRGNSTLEAPKKSFRIKFNEKTSLFNLEKAKSWVLLANYYDKSNVRNYLAYLMANKLTNLYFQPSSIFVDVYLNDTYQGLYLLTEQMQTGKGRVDIEEDTSSFLLELDFLDRAQNEGILNQDYIIVNNRCFTIKYPEEEALSDDKISFIKNFMETAMSETSLKRYYEDYLNIPAFIDFYLIQELFKNVDCGNASIYYYLQDGKLTPGPVWDFDIGLDTVGDHDPYEYYQYSDIWAANQLLFNQNLLTIPEYKQQVQERYLKIKQTILFQIYGELEIVSSYLKKAQERNIRKWPLPGDLTTYISSRYNRNYENLTTIEEHYIYLKNMLDKRFSILDSYLSGNKVI